MEGRHHGPQHGVEVGVHGRPQGHEVGPGAEPGAGPGQHQRPRPVEHRGVEGGQEPAEQFLRDGVEDRRALQDEPGDAVDDVEPDRLLSPELDLVHSVLSFRRTVRRPR